MFNKQRVISKNGPWTISRVTFSSLNYFIGQNGPLTYTRVAEMVLSINTVYFSVNVVYFSVNTVYFWVNLKPPTCLEWLLWWFGIGLGVPSGLHYVLRWLEVKKKWLKTKKLNCFVFQKFKDFSSLKGLPVERQYCPWIWRKNRLSWRKGQFLPLRYK